MLSVSQRDIDYAVDRVVAFARVNRTRTKEQKVESLNLLASAVGLDGSKFDYLLSKVRTNFDDEGNIIVGVLLGLFMQERASL